MEKFKTCGEHQSGFLNRGRSLLVVVSSPPQEDRYQEFIQKVEEYNAKEPFNLVTPNILKKDGFQKVSDTATI
jgi:hypothetical protein